MYSNVSKRSEQLFGNTFARLALLKPEKSSPVPSGGCETVPPVISLGCFVETRRIRHLSTEDSQSRGNFINACLSFVILSSVVIGIRRLLQWSSLMIYFPSAFSPYPASSLNYPFRSLSLPLLPPVATYGLPQQCEFYRQDSTTNVQFAAELWLSRIIDAISELRASCEWPRESGF